MGSIQALHLESSRRRHRDENGLRDWNTFSHQLSHPPVTAFCGLPSSATSPRAVEPPKEPATRTRGGCLSPISATDLLSREPGKPRSSRVAWLALLRPPLLPLTLSTAPTHDRRSQKLPRGRRLARRHRRPRVVTRLEPRRPAVSILVRAPPFREGRPYVLRGVNLRVAFSASRRPNDVDTDTPCRTASWPRLSSRPVHGTEDPFHRRRANAAAFQARSAFRR
jgi:hypothetical protein